MSADLPPLGPHDHPEPQTMVWSELELRAIRAYARHCLAAQAAEVEALRAEVAAERERCAKLAAWLQWCLDHCDDSPEWSFGTAATEHMRSLLAGGDAPTPNVGIETLRSGRLE